MAEYIKLEEIKSHLDNEINYFTEEHKEAVETDNTKRADAITIQLASAMNAKALLNNLNTYEFDGNGEIGEHLYWEEMIDDPAGRHRCPVCKKPAFYYTNGMTIFEDLSKYCHECGQRLYVDII